MSKKLTPWVLTSEITPTLHGVYQASVYKDYTYYRYWNGKYWSRAFIFSDKRKKEIKSLYSNNEIYWRGLAQDPAIKPKKVRK